MQAKKIYIYIYIYIFKDQFWAHYKGPTEAKNVISHLSKMKVKWNIKK